MTVDQARELLRPRELLLTLQAEQSDPAVPAGNIAGQVPLAGSRAARGTAVQAFVSSGASATTVPSLAGYRPDDALEQLRMRKLLPGLRREEASDTVAAGLVTGTEPPSGRTVAPERHGRAGGVDGTGAARGSQASGAAARQGEEADR